MSAKFGTSSKAHGAVSGGTGYKGSSSKLAKEEGIKMEGTVVDVLPNAMFRVKVDNMEKEVMGIISGKMRMNNIKILLGDRVEIEFSAYDLTKGRITRRR